MPNEYEPFASKAEQQAFKEWLKESQYNSYDSEETFIHMPTKKLFSFAEVFEKFLKEPIAYNLGGIEFYIPLNAAGEELDEVCDEEDYEEQERFARWMENEIERQQLINE